MNPERMKRQAARVIQLLPADGWRAVYAGKDGKPWADRLVCWALVATPDGNNDRDFGEVLPWSEQAVVGLVADSDGDVTPACGTASFLAYAAADDDFTTFEEQAASKHEEMKQKGWRA
jgi:hypothetical protein